MEWIFVAFFVLAAIIFGFNIICNTSDVPWWLKSQERLIHEQTQLIRDISNRRCNSRGRSRGRNGKSLPGQSQILIASAEDVQRATEKEKGYVPDYVEGVR